MRTGRPEGSVPLAEDAELRRERYPYRGAGLPGVPDDYDKLDVEERWSKQPNSKASPPARRSTSPYALRHAFWVQSRNISHRAVILAAAETAADTVALDLAALAAALDDGRARHLVTAHYQVARTDAVVCSPHLFLPDGTSHPNPGIMAHYTADYGIGFPIVTTDDPDTVPALLERAAAR